MTNMRKAAVLTSAVSVALAATLTTTPAQAMPDLRPATSNVTLSVLPEQAYEPVIDFIRSARKTLDYNIYQFNDDTIARELKAAHRRGVDVRVMFTWQTFAASSDIWNDDDSNVHYNKNMPTFKELKKAGIGVRLSPFQYTYSHEKTMIADSGTAQGRALIMDFNAQPSYFVPTVQFGVQQVGSRGFAVTTSNQQDVKEIQAVFDADWHRRPPPNFTSPRLIWSPSGAGYNPRGQGKERVFALMDGAKTSLDVYALLIDYPPFQRRLIAAAERGVEVRVITNTSPAPMSYAQLKEIAAAGVKFAFNPTYPGGLMFVHSKAIVRDVGTSNQMAFVGSQNPGDYVSLTSERELGILLGKPSIIEEMHTIYNQDWERSKPLTYVNGEPVNPFIK